MTSIELSQQSPVKAFDLGVSSSSTAVDGGESQGYFLNPIFIDIIIKPNNLITLFNHHPSVGMSNHRKTVEKNRQRL